MRPLVSCLRHLTRNIAAPRISHGVVCALTALWIASPAAAVTQTTKLMWSRINRPLLTLDSADLSVTPEGGYLKKISYQDLTSLTHTADGWGGGYTSLVTFDRSDRDDNKIFVSDRFGDEKSLHERGESATAYHGEAALSRSIGMFDLKLDGRSSLGRDLFYIRQLTVSLTASLLTEGLRLGMDLSRTKADRPLTTFLDRDFRTKFRPTEVTSDSLQATAEQIIGERNKVGVVLSVTGANEERPPHLGLLLQTATALRDTLFVKTAFATQREQRSRPLMNERGYFTLNSAALGVADEPWYDILLECEGTYMQESEIDPRVKEKRALTSRSLGIGASFKRFQPGIEVGALATELDTNEVLLSMEGAIIWNF